MPVAARFLPLCVANFVRRSSEFSVPAFSSHTVWNGATSHAIVKTTAKNVDVAGSDRS